MEDELNMSAEQIRERQAHIVSAKQIREIIEPISADQFCVGMYSDGGGKCCFIGHINNFMRDRSDLTNRSDLTEALQRFCPPGRRGDVDGFGARSLTKKFLDEVHAIQCDGTYVNNTQTVNGYTEPEIKDRLMHMIDDMIEAGY